MPFPTSHRGQPPGSGHLGVVLYISTTIQLLHYYYRHTASIKKLNKYKRSERTARVMCQRFRGVGETNPTPEPWPRPLPQAHLT